MGNNNLTVDGLNRLSAQIKENPILPKWFEQKLFKDYKETGDIEAKNKIVLSNLRLVLNVVKNISYANEMKDDIIQEGLMALETAVEKFDYTRGAKFSTYAYYCIEWAIKKYILIEKKQVRLTQSEKYKVEKLIEAKEVLTNLNNAYPTDAQLIEYLKKDDISIEDIRQIEFNFYSIFHSEERIEEIESKNTLDLSETNLKEELKIQHNSDILFKEIENLSEIEANIIKLKYGFDGSKPLTLQQIGNIYGRSKERIRQILARALFKLERKLNRKID